MPDARGAMRRTTRPQPPSPQPTDRTSPKGTAIPDPPPPDKHPSHHILGATASEHHHDSNRLPTFPALIDPPIRHTRTSLRNDPPEASRLEAKPWARRPGHKPLPAPPYPTNRSATIRRRHPFAVFHVKQPNRAPRAIEPRRAFVGPASLSPGMLSTRATQCQTNSPGR